MAFSFPVPWTFEDHNDACFIVKDALFGSASPQRWEIKVRLLLRRIFALAGVALQLFESYPALISYQNRIRVKEGPDRVSAKILRCAYPFCRGVPIAEIVNL
jgi:hypothetical protein